MGRGLRGLLAGWLAAGGGRLRGDWRPKVSDPPAWGRGHRRSAPAPTLPTPRSSAQYPGAGRSRGRGCRADPAAAPGTPQLKRARLGDLARARARSAVLSFRRTDRPTDAPAHADAQSSARPPSHTRARRHIQGHTQTHAPSRALSLPAPSCPPARPPAGAWSPLWPVSAAPPSAPLCVKPEGRGCGVPPGASEKLRSRAALKTRARATAPATPPMGLPAPPGLGEGFPSAEEGVGPGRERQPLPTKLLRGWGGMKTGVQVPASTNQAGARLLVASSLQSLNLRKEAGIACGLLVSKPRVPACPRLHLPQPFSLNQPCPTHSQNKNPARTPPPAYCIFLDEAQAPAKPRD